MARPRKLKSLFIWMNGELVGEWRFTAKQPQELIYADTWHESPRARPLSLSMPLGTAGTTYRGALVEHYFENLLPDSKAIRNRLSQRFGTSSDRAPDLLAEIGRDCVGAIQLTADREPPGNVRKIRAEPLSEAAIAQLLRATTSATALGPQVAEDEFRISLAGAQEKTALLRLENKWLRPEGATPTTHILKLPIGEANQGIDLSRSVENEWLCAQILRGFGVPTAHCWMDQFEEQRVLVVERFDRRFSPNGKRILRLPQEDMCQATGTNREHKYESHGGPGIQVIMQILLGSSAAQLDRLTFFRAQILFWCLCAIDGHAKNFSVFLSPGGAYHLTPLYDVISAFPVLGTTARKLSPHKVKMAMSVPSENRKHYHWGSIDYRHWQYLAKRCAIADQLPSIISELHDSSAAVLDKVQSLLPKDFPASVASSIFKGMRACLKKFPARLEA